MNRTILIRAIGLTMTALSVPPGAWAGTQEHTVGKKPVLVEPGPRLPSVLYSNGAVNQLETETVWKPLCADTSNLVTVDELRRIAQISKAAAAAHPPPDEVQPNVAGAIPPRFNLVFNPTTSMPAGALAALAEVEYYFEAQFTDPITVTINIAFAAMGPGILGGTSSNYVTVTWPNARDGLINGMDANDTIQAFIPPGSTIPVRYDGNSATVTNENRVFATIANYRATIGTVTGLAASMTFNNQFSWDYDPPIFEVGGTFDFQSVIVHEVGHALGFTSGADFRFFDIEMLDIFRFQRSDGTGDYNPDDFAEFTTTARMVDQNAPGTNDDVNSDLITVEYQMSDGVPSQASHFRDQFPVIGIMDPTIGSGQTFYPNFLRTPDLNMFDAIGWDYPHLNQSCRDASEIACNSMFHFDNLPISATPLPSFSCGDGALHAGAVWFVFTATHASAFLSTCDSQAADSTFAVYQNDCGSLVEIACGETGGCANPNHASLCVTGLIPGNTYFVQVSSRSLATRGIIELDIECSCQGACCLPPPVLCLSSDEDECTQLGGSFSGGQTTCSTDLDLDGRDDTCQSQFLAYSQVPTHEQEGLPSNFDASDVTPNIVLAESFQSDGRAVRALRWWGSVLDPTVDPDGWLIGFHEPLVSGGSQSPALGLYFCGTESIVPAPMNFDTCDLHDVIQYEVSLLDCCLLYAFPDSRSGMTPAAAGGFLSEDCTEYALSIQALAGVRYDLDELGECVATMTAASAAGDFWGWQSTVDDQLSGQSLAGAMADQGGVLVFEPWSPALGSCGEAVTSFELLTSDPLIDESMIIWANGQPNNVDALNSQFGGARDNWLTVDDVEFANAAVINDVHWLNEEQNTFAWDNKVRLEIYPDNGGAPDESGGPTVAMWIPDDGGSVDRVALGPGQFAPRYRYEVTGLNIALGPGRWWIGLASAGTEGSTGFSFWLTSHRQGVSPVFLGSEAYTRAPDNGIPNFVPWSSRNGGILYDVSFDLTASVSIDCTCGGAASVGLDCNANGIPDGCEPDCNANGIPDDCDIASETSLDCQQNGRPDECDIAFGHAVDADGDNVPDECCEIIVTPQRDPLDSDKSRFITLPPPPPGLRAIRVRLSSLHHPVPPYGLGPVADFSSFEGEFRWVGPPTQYVESTSSGIPFLASTLQCTPHYADWSALGAVHVTGREVVPSSIYDIQWITDGCFEASEGNYSASLPIPTTRWGDVEIPFSPPDPTTQPNAADIAAMVNKFRGAVNAPIKVRTMLSGEIPDLAPDLNFIHIAACVNAFRGEPYPHAGPLPCP